MDKFDWEKNREAVQEWNELYSNMQDLLKDGNEYEIDAPLYTMVMTEPHTFKKLRLTTIKKVNNIFVGDYISIKTDDGMWVNVYPQFELKTEGKIKDIVLILMFIKDSIKKNNIKVAEETII